ncbi:MAG: hypothetical protein EXR69_13305 [Myxococcales bacterium]|nr:hypothetical protein [Myxococcales bacterium]
MLTALLLLPRLAQATDIGSDLKLGLGAATGDVYVAFSGKYWLSESTGVTAMLGTSIVYQSMRIGYESNVMIFGENWGFGQLPLYWHADLELSANTVPYAFYPRIGAGGGAGAALQFESVPAEVFVNAGFTVGYSGYCSSSYGALGAGLNLACLIRPLATVGGRWYF